MTGARAGLVPISPDVRGLRFQAVHADDVGDAYRRAVVTDVSGSFNIAAEPVVGSDELARMLRARKVSISPRVLRAAAAASYKLRLQASEPGWLDMALGVPLMSTERARRELGWRPTRTALEAIQELVVGMRERADYRTPPLAAQTGGRARVHELLTGIGKRA